MSRPYGASREAILNAAETLIRERGVGAMSVADIIAAAGTSAGLNAKALCRSPIRGATGNAEYLLWLTPRPDQGLTPAQVTQLAATLSTEAFT